MYEAGETRNLPVIAVYWFLTAIALALAGFALREVWRIRELKPLQVRVIERMVEVEVRMVSSRQSSSRKSPFLIAITKLRLERLDDRSIVTQTLDRRLTNDEFVTLEFLDAWQPGTVSSAMARGGTVDLEPVNPWLPPFGLGIAAWMFGTFAWMTKPFATGGDTSGMGWKFLALGLLPVGAGAFGIGTNMWKDRQEKEVRRAPVEGRSKQMPVPELVANAAALGVKMSDEARKHLGGGDDSVHFCEFEWQGKTWRTTSLWCQPPEGVSVVGRLNPANPRDVKWGEEP